MTLSYSVRLLCMCFAAFFLIHAVLVLSVEIVCPARHQICSRHHAEIRFPLLVRAANVAACAGGCCCPRVLLAELSVARRADRRRTSRLALHRDSVVGCGDVRRVNRANGEGCMAFGANGQGLEIMVALETPVGAEHVVATVVQQQAPVLAVAGIVRPRLIVSSSVLQALSARN